MSILYYPCSFAGRLESARADLAEAQAALDGARNAQNRAQDTATCAQLHAQLAERDCASLRALVASYEADLGRPGRDNGPAAAQAARAAALEVIVDGLRSQLAVLERRLEDKVLNLACHFISISKAYSLHHNQVAMIPCSAEMQSCCPEGLLS